MCVSYAIAAALFSAKGRIFEQIKGAGCGNAQERGNPSAFEFIFYLTHTIAARPCIIKINSRALIHSCRPRVDRELLSFFRLFSSIKSSPSVLEFQFPRWPKVFFVQNSFPSTSDMMEWELLSPRQVIWIADFFCRTRKISSEGAFPYIDYTNKRLSYLKDRGTLAFSKDTWFKKYNTIFCRHVSLFLMTCGLNI